MTLDQINLNQTVQVQAIFGSLDFRHQLFCIGCVPHVDITLIQKTPFHNPCLYRIHTSIIALRLEDAQHIEVSP